MNLPSWHKHVSERQPGAWIDCTWDSGVEYVRLTHNKSVPATHAEGDALRVAGGRASGGGGTIENLRTGIKVRYGYVATAAVHGFAALWAALKPGTACVAQGSMIAFGPKDVLSRFDPTFDGGHAVLIMRLDSTDRVWWCDPEAPAGSYKGEWVSKSKLKAFIDAFSGGHIVAPILAEAATETTEPPMPTITSYTPGYTAVFKAGTNVRSTPDTTKPALRQIKAGEKVAVVGKAKGALALGSTDWVTWVEGGKFVYNHVSNLVSLTAPAPAVDQSAEVAKLSAEVNALTAEQATLTTERDAARAQVAATYANIDALKG